VGVAVVESDAKVRAMLEAILRPSDEFRLCGEFATAGDALREMGDDEADLVLIEMALPDRCGIRCALELRERRPGLKVIVTTTLSSPVFIHHAVAAGISEVLVRPFRPSQCLASLRLVACRAGRPIGSPRLEAGPERLLNGREEKVMQGLDQGLLYKEIEDVLGMSHAVVKKVQHRAFNKLHAHTRAEAVRRWRECHGAPEG
jgi:two-component system response regulator DesR